MNAVVLASGFAPKLHPLTLTQPKALLQVGGRPLIDYVIGPLSAIEKLGRTYVVANSRFAPLFHKWLGSYLGPHGVPDVVIVDDGSTDESNKLGAVGDLNFVVRQEELAGDLIVAAADNLFSEPLDGFGRFCQGRTAPVLAVYDVGTVDLARKYGVVEIDREGRVASFVEKPQNPASRHVSVGLYYFPRSLLSAIPRYLDEGHNADAPGGLVQWMLNQLGVVFQTWAVPGTWYDVGSKETLEEANRIFTRR